MIILLQVSLKKISRTAFLRVDEQSGFNLLQAAVFEGMYDIVLEASGLLENFVKEMKLTRMEKNAKQFQGSTAVGILYRFFGHRHHRDIELIYEQFAEENRRLTMSQWGTCHDDAEQAVELVLNDGVDINASGSDNDWTALLRASRSSSSQFIETLIDLGADVNAQRKERKETPLILAADWNNYMAAYLLVRHGADVNVQISKGLTPLHLSIKKNHENLIKLLLANKVNVNTQDNDKNTPLFVSARRNDENLVRLFLEHNADVNMKGDQGYTPLHLCAREGNENLCRLLLEHNADVNIQGKDGYTPLHWCVREGNENLCRLLLEHNADANIQDNNGYTPLHRAVMNGAVNLIGLLLEHKADVNIQHKFGFTPLHLSARFRHKDCNKIIDLLLQYGVQNIDIRDVEGRTPLQMAVRCGNAQAVKKLVDLGADVSLVKADKKDGVELERLYYEAKNVE